MNTENKVMFPPFSRLGIGSSGSIVVSLFVFLVHFIIDAVDTDRFLPIEISGPSFQICFKFRGRSR
jgi:hypothetical protein